MKILFFPFYLCCFAACWSTTGGNSCRVIKWVGTSVVTAAATTGVTYQTTMWLVPALQNCHLYGSPTLVQTPRTPPAANAPSILFNNKYPSAALPTAAKLKSEELLNPLLYKTAATPTSPTTSLTTTPTIPPTISYPTINTPKAQVKQDVLTKTYFNLFPPANVKVPTPTSSNDTSLTTPCLRRNTFDNTHDAVVGACLTLVTACIAYIAGEKKTMKNITHYQRIASTTHNHSATHNQMTDLATPNQLHLPLPMTPLAHRH